MIRATRDWLRRNRINFAVGFGVIGVGYLASQYVLSKITEANQRMNNDRTAKENLRRRFQQNQEDCTITVLALLPTVTENVITALPVESITNELQQKKAERRGRNTATLGTPISELSSGPPSVTDGDGKSLGSLESESYVLASQMGAASSENKDAGSQGPTKSKGQLWNDLKINSITRSFTLLYTLSLLTLFTRIQLNLLGRQNYVSSVVSSASHPSQDLSIHLENNDDDDNAEQSYGNGFETNRKFLSFSWWLLHRGWADIKQKVEDAVRDVFGPLNPREEIEPERLSHLVLEVRRKVEGTTLEERRNRKWLAYLLPPPDQEDFVLHESGMSTSSNQSQRTSLTTTSPTPSSSTYPYSSRNPPPLRRLLDEASDLVDSPPFSQTLTLLLDATFSHLTDTNIRSQAFKNPLSPLSQIQELPSSSTSPSLSDPAQHNHSLASTKLANILAVMTRQAHAIGNGISNEYVQAIEAVRELEAFAAVIYNSNFELENVVREVTSASDPTRAGEEKRESERGIGNVVLDKATGLVGDLWGKVIGRC